MNISKSKSAFTRALKSLPGGVNSPVRSFKSIDGNPLFIESAKGASITDIDGNTFIDYVGSWGPMILGHAHPLVLKALSETMLKGTSFGAPTERETELAELIKTMVPSIECVRMVNSGTEATMSSLRLARGFTKRDLVIKFEGCYHGHSDSFLIQAGSGALTLSIPNSPGVTESNARDTLVAQFNDLSSVEKLFDKNKDKIAALIVEPVTGNMGVVLPSPDFLKGLRELCTQHGTVLIFDEVMTGFRLAKGGAQELYGIKPDLTTLGKIIGGGLPVGAYGGRAEIMDMLAPKGPVYQAGTLSGNPLAMAAGLATLNNINADTNFYLKLEQTSAFLHMGMQKALNDLRVPGVINRCGSMFTLFFTKKEKVESFADVMTCDTKFFTEFFKLSLEAGIYLAPSQFEAGFVSAAHTHADIEKTIECSYKALESLSN